MKRIYFTIVVMLALLLNACTNMEITQMEEEFAATAHLQPTNVITQDEAVDIAHRVIGRHSTRSAESEPSVDCVYSTSPTRSASSDTVAYVINFPNNGGFAIIASDNRVYPVLGFSREGQFSFTNEIAKVNFIDKIENYIENAPKTSTYDVGESDFDGCYSVEPVIQISLGQRSPWDKYVIQEYPGCPVGCVAVATALVMSHSRFQLSYHGVNYPLKSIIDAINRGPVDNLSNENEFAKSRRIVGPPSNLPTYTYNQAVDSMAKILYLIGKDVDMNYGTEQSGTDAQLAHELCKSLNLSPTEYAIFDINDVTRYIDSGYIVFLRGNDIRKRNGHAWVSDGCYYCVIDNDRTQITEAFIHCDWGWGGLDNGYFCGEVFSAGGYLLRPGNYFAVKRDPLLN